MRFDVEGYVSSKLDAARPVASGHGGEYTASCPGCKKSSKFYVNIETGRFLCNSCGIAGRSVAGLVALVEDISYSHALRYVFKNSVELPRKSDMLTLRERIKALRDDGSTDDGPIGPVDFDLPRGFTPCYRSVKGADKWKLIPYLKLRGLKSLTAKAWGLGYVSSVEIRDKVLKGQRLVIPIECPAGKSWTARATSSKAWGPKYVNPAGADHSRLLIGWNMVRFGGDVVICEGPLDAVRLWQHAVPALALGGKVLHDYQMAQLAQLPRDTAITIMLDPEELVAPHDVARSLSSHFKSIYVAKLPDGTDPGNSSRDEAHGAMERAARWSGDRSARLGDRLKASRRRVEGLHS